MEKIKSISNAHGRCTVESKFPTFELLRFWLQKKISFRIIEKMNNFYHGIFFVNLLEKHVILVNRVILLI